MIILGDSRLCRLHFCVLSGAFYSFYDEIIKNHKDNIVDIASCLGVLQPFRCTSEWNKDEGLST